jgi:hypothetical protein
MEFIDYRKLCFLHHSCRDRELHFLIFYSAIYVGGILDVTLNKTPRSSFKASLAHQEIHAHKFWVAGHWHLLFFYQTHTKIKALNNKKGSL